MEESKQKQTKQKMKTEDVLATLGVGALLILAGLGKRVELEKKQISCLGRVRLSRVFEKRKYLGKYVEINVDAVGNMTAYVENSFIDWNLNYRFLPSVDIPRWSSINIKGYMREHETMRCTLLTEHGTVLNGEVYVELC